MSAPLPSPPIVDDASARMLSAAPRAALFLDRDGVINVDHGYVCTPERTDWMPAIFELVGAARDAGMPCIVLTNQAGIARGYYDESAFDRYTRWMHAQFRSRGVPLLATYHCPHHPDSGVNGRSVVCDCRKPAPGMLLAAIRDFDIDPARSLLIGDKLSDIEAAVSAGVCRHFLVGERDLTGALVWFRHQLEDLACPT